MQMNTEGMDTMCKLLRTGINLKNLLFLTVAGIINAFGVTFSFTLSGCMIPAYPALPCCFPRSPLPVFPFPFSFSCSTAPFFSTDAGKWDFPLLSIPFMPCLSIL